MNSASRTQASPDVRPMAGKTVLVTGASGGIGRATAVGLGALGAHLAIIGRDRERTEGAAREIRAAGGGQVEVSSGTCPPSRRCDDWPTRCSGAFPGSMCWSTTLGAIGTLDTSPRTVSSTPSPSTIWRRSCSPICSSTGYGRAPRPAWSRSLPTRRLWGDRLRGPPGRTVLLRRAGLQPVQARQRPVHLRAGQEAAGHLRHRQCAASRRGQHILWRPGPPPHPATAHPVPAPVHEVPGQGRRHVDPSGVRSRSRAGDGRLLRQRQTEEILEAQLRRGCCGTALAGER
jgi:hypothetical protein